MARGLRASSCDGLWAPLGPEALGDRGRAGLESPRELTGEFRRGTGGDALLGGGGRAITVELRALVEGDSAVPFCFCSPFLAADVVPPLLRRAGFEEADGAVLALGRTCKSAGLAGRAAKDQRALQEQE